MLHALRRSGIALSLLAVACSRPATKVVAADSTPWRKPGDKVDSLLPMAEYIRRFRVGVPQVESLTGGAASRDQLVRDFTSAVSHSDTNALRSMMVTRAEFAWLLFPGHLYSRPPYELDPDVVWMQLINTNSTGLTRLLQRYGGKPLYLGSVRCGRDTLQLTAATGKVWAPCQLTFRVQDSTLTRKLFGSIVERDGRAKFLSYANDF